MKNIISKILLLVLCLMISVATVGATIDWTVGEQFEEIGQTFYREVGKKKGDINNGLYIYSKHTEAAMIIELSAESPNILGTWKNFGSIKQVNMAAGIGDVNPNPVYNYYNLSSEKKVRFKWEQTRSGWVSADLLYTK